MNREEWKTLTAVNIIYIILDVYNHESWLKVIFLKSSRIRSMEFNYDYIIKLKAIAMHVYTFLDPFYLFCTTIGD